MEENNILLADFLGWEEQTDPTKKWLGAFRTPEGIVHKNTNKEPLLFPSDWNWLMEVVTKAFNTIEEINIKDEMEWDFRIKQINNAFIFPKIEDVYNACVEFVKWYNAGKE